MPAILESALKMKHVEDETTLKLSACCPVAVWLGLRQRMIEVWRSQPGLSSSSRAGCNTIFTFSSHTRNSKVFKPQTQARQYH